MRIEHVLPGHLVARKPVRVLVVGAGGSVARSRWVCPIYIRPCAYGDIPTVSK